MKTRADLVMAVDHYRETRRNAERYRGSGRNVVMSESASMRRSLMRWLKEYGCRRRQGAC
jgi:hypothetical protein